MIDYIDETVKLGSITTPPPKKNKKKNKIKTVTTTQQIQFQGYITKYSSIFFA